MPGPLAGLRVVDFGHYVAGPLAGVMLADQGAEVVRVDRPGAQAAAAPADAFLSRGKRRITLDLTTEADRATARALVERADVVIENFRPGVMERFGLGWADLRESCPRLVYLSLPGFAPDDPRARVRAFEGVIDAATNNCRPRMSEAPAGWDMSRPTYSALPVASNFAALLGAVGVVAALIERLRSGRGQRACVPLYDAVFEAIGDAGTYANSAGQLKPEFPLRTILGAGTYRCADDGYVQFNPIGATPRFRDWLLQEAGHPEWAALDDETLCARLAEMFRGHPAAYWENLGRRAGVPIARVRTAREWLATPHARASGAVTRLDDPVLGPTWMAGIPVHVGNGQGPDGLDHPLQPRRLPDADRAEILAELAAPAPAPHPGSAGAVRESPLAGLRVLDLTQILAGPSSGRILGELGAEVIKINAPQRQIAAHSSINRGKQSILLDIKHVEGQQVFWRLVDQADVVVLNFPPGTAERYGIGYEAVRTRRPGIVYASVSCFGGIGPWARGRGYEAQGQAVTGVMARTGGPNPPAIFGPYTVLDYGTGVTTAFAALLGIYHHASTGEGLRVGASLAQTGTLHQASLMLDHAASGPAAEPAGVAALGAGPLMRFYQAADTWFFLGATAADRPRLDGIDGLDGLAGITDPDELACQLEQAFAARPAAAWVAALRAVGLGAHETVTLAELMTDPLNLARGVSVRQISEEAGEITMPGVALALSDTPARVGRAVRPPGADGVQVLERAGLGDEVPALEKHWAVQTQNLPAGWP
jgi:crotonobetainyl-CoA:carnitine CoA-transferase CaiB-like acyl-CoA transferase